MKPIYFALLAGIPLAVLLVCGTVSTVVQAGESTTSDVALTYSASPTAYETDFGGPGDFDGTLSTGTFTDSPLDNQYPTQDFYDQMQIQPLQDYAGSAYAGSLSGKHYGSTYTYDQEYSAQVTFVPDANQAYTLSVTLSTSRISWKIDLDQNMETNFGSAIVNYNWNAMKPITVDPPLSGTDYSYTDAVGDVFEDDYFDYLDNEQLDDQGYLVEEQVFPAEAMPPSSYTRNYYYNSYIDGETHGETLNGLGNYQSRFWYKVQHIWEIVLVEN